MLVLSRKACERIVLTVKGTEITVLVSSICGDKARIGIEADKEVKILRGEVKDREEAEKKEVAHA